MIRTKSITAPAEPGDGLRISVMSRHTLDDGVTPNQDIQHYDLWERSLAPPDKLVGAYYKRGLAWTEYQERYRQHLRRPEIAQRVEWLARQGLEGTVTLLCVEESADHCHRRILAEECRTYEPGLEIEHR